MRPIWNEFFTFSLTGEAEENLLFEVFRHNSCEGDLPIDSFEVKLNEDPDFFQQLADQNNHFLLFAHITNHQGGTNHPSFETDRDSSGNEGEPLPSSTFKVLFKWRHSELELKAQHIKRQITLIESKRVDEEAAMKDALDKYTRLLQFKDQGAAALLAEWGVAHLPKRTIMTSPRAKAAVSPKPPAFSAPRTGSPVRCKTAQAQSSVERSSSPYQALNKAATTKRKIEASPVSDNPYQFKKDK